MRQLSSVVPYPGKQVGLPAVVEELLADVVADGFTLYCCGPKVAPNALVACYEWYRYVDLLTIRDFDRIITARVPKRRPVNIFAPDVVVWAYEGLSQDALHALLTLVHPEHPNAPIAEYPAPASLHVPRAQQRPMTIQLPTPGRAKARAARLAAVMAVDGRDRPSMPPRGSAHKIPAGRQSRERSPTLGSWRPAGHYHQSMRSDVHLLPDELSRLDAWRC